jgi:hypothetical protein
MTQPTQPTRPVKTVKSQRVDERHTLLIDGHAPAAEARPPRHIDGAEYRVMATEHTEVEVDKPIIVYTSPNGVFRFWYDEDVTVLPLPPRRPGPRTVRNPIL